ncbi:hypothetical protein QE152_g11302 [Popillia japonica]|uniref:Uncharacterized protein n=1 Tax=Popillia japonica TaxID=7064 RepID=A0AAW1LL24_POPJA
MKVIVAILFVLGCASARYRGPSNRVLESEIQNIIDCGLRLIPDPVDEPEAATVLDDLEIEGLSGTAAVVNAYVSGISNYEHTYTSGSIGLIPPRYDVEATVTFPRIQASVDNYDIDINYATTGTHIYGAGIVAFDATGFSISASLSVHILTGISVQNIRVRPALQGLNSGIVTGLYNDEEFSRQLTEDFLNDPAGTMAGYADMVDQIASSIAGKVVANALAGDGDAGFLDNCYGDAGFLDNC